MLNASMKYLNILKQSYSAFKFLHISTDEVFGSLGNNGLFNETYMRRLNVLPGITGLLQINERNTPEFSIWYKYDIEYIENWNLYLDVKILFKTFSALKRNDISGK